MGFPKKREARRADERGEDAAAPLTQLPPHNPLMGNRAPEKVAAKARA